MPECIDATKNFILIGNLQVTNVFIYKASNTILYFIYYFSQVFANKNYRLKTITLYAFNHKHELMPRMSAPRSLRTLGDFRKSAPCRERTLLTW